MMSRRRFLQMTVSLAAVSAAGGFVAGELAPSKVPAIAPALGAIWVPTVAEVAEWLEYYKLCVTGSHRRFAQIIESLGTGPGETDAEFTKEFSMAERDFYRFESERRRVAYEQGSGYNAGLSGAPRHSVAFKYPSHPGFGWYNYWALGDFDRRRALGLPRSGRTLEEEYAALGHPAQPLVHVKIERTNPLLMEAVLRYQKTDLS
jgi:hypothetical protein